MPSRIAVSVPPWARTMPAARLLAPSPSVAPRAARHFDAALGEQHGRPRTDRSTTHHHDVGAAGAGHTMERWHRLNAQSRARRGCPDVRSDGGGSAHPRHGAELRRVADAARGRGRAGRRHTAQGAHGRASGARNRIGPVRHQHAGVGRRAGLHGAAAGAGAGTVRAGDQRARLGDGDAAAVVGRGGHRLPARALAAAVGARREARGVRDHRGVRRLRRVGAADHRAP